MNASRTKVASHGMYGELIAMGTAFVVLGLVAIAYHYLGQERANPNTVSVVAVEPER